MMDAFTQQGVGTPEQSDSEYLFGTDPLVRLQTITKGSEFDPLNPLSELTYGAGRDPLPTLGTLSRETQNEDSQQNDIMQLLMQLFMGQK